MDQALYLANSSNGRPEFEVVTTAGKSGGRVFADELPEVLYDRTKPKSSGEFTVWLKAFFTKFPKYSLVRITKRSGMPKIYLFEADDINCYDIASRKPVKKQIAMSEREALQKINAK